MGTPMRAPAAPHRLTARPAFDKPDAEMMVDKLSLVLVCYLGFDALTRTELNDGQLGRFRTSMGLDDVDRIMYVRETLKHVSLVSRLTSLMEEAHPGAVRRVHMTAIPRAGETASDILGDFLQNPEVLDYTRLWGYRFMVELAPDLTDSSGDPTPPQEILAAALRTLMEGNNEKVGSRAANTRSAPQEGGEAAAARKKQRGTKRGADGAPRMTQDQLLEEVEKATGSQVRIFL